MKFKSCLIIGDVISLSETIIEPRIIVYPIASVVYLINVDIVSRKSTIKISGEPYYNVVRKSVSDTDYKLFPCPNAVKRSCILEEDSDYFYMKISSDMSSFDENEYEFATIDVRSLFGRKKVECCKLKRTKRIVKEKEFFVLSKEKYSIRGSSEKIFKLKN